MDTKKVLAGRVTKAQKQSLLQLMHENRALGCGQFSGPDSARKQKDEWTAIVHELNGKGGASKNSDQWKRASVKRHYSALKPFNAQTGNLPSTSDPKQMKDLDEEMLQFFAKDRVEADTGTTEIGLITSAPTQSHLEEEAEEIEIVGEYLDDEFCISFSESAAQINNVRSAKPANPSTNLLSQFQHALDISSAQNTEQTALLKQLVEEQQKTNKLLAMLLEK